MDTVQGVAESDTTKLLSLSLSPPTLPDLVGQSQF